MEKFIEQIEDKEKWLYATYLQQPITEFTDVLKCRRKMSCFLKSLAKILDTRRNTHFGSQL